MRIIIRSTGEFVLDVEPTFTIEKVKQIIQEQREIKVDLQQLNYEGKLLENEKTIGDYNIKEETIVELILKPRIWFFVKTSTGQTLHLNLDPNATLKDIKILIEKSIGAPVINQRLELAGKILDNNDLPIKEYNIKNDSTINMTVSENTGVINIRVKNYSQTFFFAMHPTDTVLEIKKKILARETVDVNIQRIIFKGKELNNDATMSDLGIQEDACLWLMLNVGKNKTEDS